ncbi:MAG: tRNA 2-thiouridine(34) synthase MnmA [Planctomycetes bacterium]|nr:tRNA 2-thiouridine(34) synthase MnmA [Planctomycetota bacterium]
MRIVVGMSGGVDSSLSAALLKERGDEVVGVTMKLWPCAEQDGGFTREDACCSPSETVDARSVAVATGVKHYVIDLEDEFRRQVVADFLGGYAQGETPNPCVRCNETIKFGSLWEHARSLGAERVATGHYARVERAFDRWVLRTAVDRTKDQTYFLFSLTQEQLAAAEFPVGGMTKDEVRDASRRRGLATADKRESMDICFIGKNGMADFLRQNIPEAFVPGPIVHENGDVLGEHQGLGAYTIGQRKGLGVAWGEPLFVVRLDHQRNVVVLGPKSSLLVTELPLRACTWHLGALPADGLPCRVRMRHRMTPVVAVIHPVPRSGTSDASRAIVRFAQPQVRASVGQACVAYDDREDLCLGGGWIDGDGGCAPSSVLSAPSDS